MRHRLKRSLLPMFSKNRTPARGQVRKLVCALSFHGRVKAGGASRDRTDDPLLAKQVLSQLSYGPVMQVVGLGGLEPPTSPLSGVRSNHLSYRPRSDHVVECRKLVRTPGSGELVMLKRR